MFDELLTYQKQNIGKRIRIISMIDPFPIPSGTMGTITGVDDIGQYQVNWDNGSTLSVIPDEDEYEILNEDGREGSVLELK
jgi:hypothetical protein